MSTSSDASHEVSTPAVASTPEITRHPDQAASRPTSTEHKLLSSAGRVAAGRSTTSSDQSLLSTISDDTTPGATSEEPTSGIGSVPSNDPHEEMHPHQGPPLKVIVEDLDAESMICWNGSVDGSIENRATYELMQRPAEHELGSCPFLVTPPPPERIFLFTECRFDPDVPVDRASRIQHVLAMVNVWFGV